LGGKWAEELENGELRMIFGLKVEEAVGDWRRLSIEGFHYLYRHQYCMEYDSKENR
jgi:hypothetical protein